MGTFHHLHLKCKIGPFTLPAKVKNASPSTCHPLDNQAKWKSAYNHGNQNGLLPFTPTHTQKWKRNAERSGDIPWNRLLWTRVDRTLIFFCTAKLWLSFKGPQSWPLQRKKVSTLANSKGHRDKLGGWRKPIWLALYNQPPACLGLSFFQTNEQTYLLRFKWRALWRRNIFTSVLNSPLQCSGHGNDNNWDNDNDDHSYLLDFTPGGRTWQIGGNETVCLQPCKSPWQCTEIKAPLLQKAFILFCLCLLWWVQSRRPGFNRAKQTADSCWDKAWARDNAWIK